MTVDLACALSGWELLNFTAPLNVKFESLTLAVLEGALLLPRHVSVNAANVVIVSPNDRERRLDSVTHGVESFGLKALLGSAENQLG